MVFHIQHVHDTMYREIILIPSQPVFALTSYCYIPSGEATNTNFIVVGLTRPALEHTTYPTETSKLTIKQRLVDSESE
jgi:hypothetical protein